VVPVVKTFSLMAAGGILLFAVNVHPSFFNLQLAGLILIARGGAGLWIGLSPRRRAHCKSQLKVAVARGLEAFEAMTASLARDDTTSVPLGDLLRQGGRD
jgi:hypothetical protein